MGDSGITRTEDHPVWEVYDLHRTCRLSYKYWSCVLARVEGLNFWLELLLALTAPSSAFAGLFFWKTDGGKTAWSILTVITAVLAPARPLLKLSERLRSLHKVVTGYRSLGLALEGLIGDIKRESRYNGELVKQFKRLQMQAAEVTKDEPVGKTSERLRKKCWQEVLTELPVSNYFVPPDESRTNKAKSSAAAASSSAEPIASA